MELKISVIVTVKNDEVGVSNLMKALDRQTVRAEEVIIIRAEKHGNCSRGRGRNIGVRMARNKVVAVTDAGCRPRRDWIEKMIAVYKGPTLPRQGRTLGTAKIVVAGGYRAAAKTELERVMAGFLVPREFSLPASRSIMFTKAAWAAVGGYPEEAVSGAEDLEFARRLAADPEVKMIYCPEAIVDWQPPKNLGEFFRDIVKHTRGNVEVGYWPHLWRNLTVAGRWGVFWVFPWMIPIYLGIKVIKIIKIIPQKYTYFGSWSTSTQPKSVTSGFGRASGFLRGKNPGPSEKVKSILLMPVVQVAADAGVMWGLVLGIMGRMSRMSRMGLMR